MVRNITMVVVVVSVHAPREICRGWGCQSQQGAKCNSIGVLRNACYAEKTGLLGQHVHVGNGKTSGGLGDDTVSAIHRDVRQSHCHSMPARPDVSGGHGRKQPLPRPAGAAAEGIAHTGERAPSAVDFICSRQHVQQTQRKPTASMTANNWG